MAMKEFINFVVSNDPNKYPTDGEQGGYWYKLFDRSSGANEIAFVITSGSTTTSIELSNIKCFHAIDGMTIQEFVDSSYNDGSVSINSSGNLVFKSRCNISYKPSDIISDRGIYHCGEPNAPV